MSTLKVNKIEATGTTDGGIEIDSDGHVQLDGVQLPTAGALSNRNVVINGAMQVAQRANTRSNITSGTTYATADRFRFDVSIGTWTADRMTNSAGDTYENGSTERFRHSMRLTCTTGDSSPTAGNNVKVIYFIEGQDAQHLNYGTTNAKTTTLSFWVKASKTGTGTVEIVQEDNSNEQFSASYTINATNTWEYKTITIPGDSSGIINSDNGRGLDIIWWLNSGPTYTGGSQGGWRALVDENRNSDNLAIGSADNDEWAITGIQLEVGDKATPFEHRSFGDELARCQRYFSRSYEYGTATQTQTSNGVIASTAYSTIAYASAGTATFPVEMRTDPDVTVYSPATGNGGEVAADNTDGTGSVTFINSRHCFLVRSNDNSGVVANAYMKAHYVAAAEL